MRAWHTGEYLEPFGQCRVQKLLGVDHAIRAGFTARDVILSAAKDLACGRARFFASLRTTILLLPA
jgi:hypothetical protein